MLFSCYLRKGFVYIPTVGKVEGGPYRQIEPVAVLPVSHAVDLQHAFEETMMRGNPAIPNLARADHGDPVILKYAGVKTYSAFGRGAQYWMIEENQGAYQIIGQRKIVPRGWVDDPKQTVRFPAHTELDVVIRRMIVILQEAAP
jgi:hypothetical protein